MQDYYTYGVEIMQDYYTYGVEIMQDYYTMTDSYFMERYITSNLLCKMNSNLHDDNTLIDTSILPDDIFTRVGDDFFFIVKLCAGDSIFNILRIQLVNSARKLLNTADIFAFFQIESEETNAIKVESCFKCKTGQYIVKPGIQASLSYLIRLLKLKFKQEQELKLNQNNEHPLLKSLIKWYQENDSEDTSKSNEFLTSFIDNLVLNLTQSSNRFRYTESIKKIATCLYILGGKQCYEFVRLNLPGTIPNMSTLRDLINQSDMTFAEAEFKFESLKQFHSGFGFYSEDTTGVIPKVEYDSSTNSFIGFATPIVDGIPPKKCYQAHKFDDLRTIYDSNEMAPLLNVHMFQSISTEDAVANFPKPFLLSAYGVTNKFTTMDILRRWMYIFENCLDKGVRVIGFSTDADNKYVSAMRLADPVHIVTKWRNRLLSSTADLCLGNDNISMVHIENLINDNTYTKLDHSLTKSDTNPKDRQNYKSCIKLISDDVLNLLYDNVDTKGTFVYLTLLKMIVKAYIDKSTNIGERKSVLKIQKQRMRNFEALTILICFGIESAWCVVFVCRLWWTWLEKTSTRNSSKTGQITGDRKNEINKFFITRPAYISVELNAHNLLYLVLLVKQQDLPKQTLLNIHLFSSQPCESLFRDARSLSSAFSTNINFTVKNFIGRAQKLSILNQMKYNQSKKDLRFPINHKQKHQHSSTSIDQLNEIDNQIGYTTICDTLNQFNINGLNDVSQYVFDILKKNSRLINYSFRTENDIAEEFGLDEENDDNDVDTYAPDQPIDEFLFDCQNDTMSDDEEDILNTLKSNFNGIRILDNINPELKRSYFKVKMNESIKYVHKQSACWLLSNNITKLSNGRLSRVMQQTTNNN
ncbi:unnamed protein product [Rotaria magnacalcarata]|uniref:Uncharacterized protein n=2 Tax=Rotaria magnacalcarata TaxID=392030 RepID=A0A8S2JHF3_9BILA|nr:unnamed protein product [Rotaria magnacalcarata]